MKEELGYNARQVSVKHSHSSITFTVRDASVNVEAVKEFSTTFENIHRDERTGDILRGGNTFVNVRLSDAVKDKFKAIFLPALEEVAPKIVDNRLLQIPGTEYLISQHDMRPGCFDLWSDEGHIRSYYGLDEIALELGKLASAKKKAHESVKVEEDAAGQEPQSVEENNDSESYELTHYEQRKQERRERYEALASKNDALSDAHFKESRKLGEMIPFGQPILVGHHSESRHRNHIKRIDNKMRKSVEASNKADYYRQKAESVGKAGISSDDPAALQKLREKLKGMDKAQNTMKAINKAWRAAGKPEADNLAAWAKVAEHPDVKVCGFDKVEEIRKRQGSTWFAGRAPFPSYSLNNNNANIKRTEKRIEELTAKQNADEVEDITGEVQGMACILRENIDINRIQLLFEGKPSSEIRKELNKNGFRWSPRQMAWQRHLNNAGRWNAKYLMGLN